MNVTQPVRTHAAPGVSHSAKANAPPNAMSPAAQPVQGAVSRHAKKHAREHARVDAKLHARAHAKQNVQEHASTVVIADARPGVTQAAWIYAQKPAKMPAAPLAVATCAIKCVKEVAIIPAIQPAKTHVMATAKAFV